MNCSIQDLPGGRFLIIEEGASTHQIHVGALASWGALLGLSDPSEVLEVILSFEEKPVGPGEHNAWTDAYNALGVGLDQMARAGVPPEFMDDLLDPGLGAPVPSSEGLILIESARTQALAAIGERRKTGPRTHGAEIAITAFKGRIANELTNEVAASRAIFLSDLAPTYELPAVADTTEQDTTNGTETQSSTGDVPAVAGELPA